MFGRVLTYIAYLFNTYIVGTGPLTTIKLQIAINAIICKICTCSTTIGFLRVVFHLITCDNGTNKCDWCVPFSNVVLYVHTYTYVHTYVCTYAYSRPSIQCSMEYFCLFIVMLYADCLNVMGWVMLFGC